MKTISRKDRKNRMGGVNREHQRCQEKHRGQQANGSQEKYRCQQTRNRAKPVRCTQASRRKSRRKRVLIHRMTAITILIGLGIAVIFLLRSSLTEDAGKAAAIKAAAVDVALTESTVAASSKESTSAAVSQGEEVTDETVKELNATTDEATADTPILHDTLDTEVVPHPFNQMSADWSEEDLKGWWRYTMPDDFERTGGYLPDIVQIYTYSLCKQNSIRYSLVLAIMEIESGYQYDAVSGTNDIGYMQVNYKWQQEKMPDMTEKALYNPYVNIRVGIEYLVELSEEFSTEEAVLTAYHYGPSGAYSRCYKNAVITSDYADKVLKAAQRIEAELQKREAEVKGEKGGAGNAAFD